jgi:hypothetical protein
MAVLAGEFNVVGGFEENFGKVGTVSRPEDTEFCLRLTAMRGVPWYYVPTAEVDHFVPSNRSTWAYYIRRCVHEGRGKAELRALPGSDHSLGTEHEYAAKLPRAATRHLFASNGQERLQAVAIGVGLMSAVLGYSWQYLKSLRYVASKA